MDSTPHKDVYIAEKQAKMEILCTSVSALSKAVSNRVQYTVLYIQCLSWLLRCHVSLGQPQLLVQNGDKAQGMRQGKARQGRGGADSGKGSAADPRQMRSKVSGCLGIRDGMRASAALDFK